MYNETITNMLHDLGLDPAYQSTGLSTLSQSESRFVKDLKLNVGAVLGSLNINKKEAYLLALSVAVNEKHSTLASAFEALAVKEGAVKEEIAEVYACTALMTTNNIFYRFKHYMHGHEFYEKQPAGLRMSAMMNPVTGKEFFELMSLVVSALNGCERCVTSHEHSVRQHGATEQRVYDAVRLGSVIKSLCVIL